ncbi:hypothetical protein Fmac_027070 [Flemingia macrophylla]|uniref:Stigma-specific Stig1 family protein n=1 Tax=Flemingia macrophylla TaxID=520843 RepID=A0ABD1LGN2_9FABA
MNEKLAQTLSLVAFIITFHLIPTQGNSKSSPNTLHQNGGTIVPSSQISRWLKKDNVVNARGVGCRGRSWVCNPQGEFPPRSLCCRNRCENVTSDRNNCGLCGIRCIFNWECCGGLCIDININFFNCGRCGNVCPIGALCLFGMCAYA